MYIKVIIVIFKKNLNFLSSVLSHDMFLVFFFFFIFSQKQLKLTQQRLL